MNPSTKDLVELAREASKIDPVDWHNLKISQDQAYELMASNVLTEFANIPTEHKLTVALATVTKLLVENFVLNLKIESDKK
jgi:hypothetical protein